MPGFSPSQKRKGAQIIKGATPKFDRLEFAHLKIYNFLYEWAMRTSLASQGVADHLPEKNIIALRAYAFGVPVRRTPIVRAHIGRHGDRLPGPAMRLGFILGWGPGDTNRLSIGLLSVGVT